MGSLTVSLSKSKTTIMVFIMGLKSTITPSSPRQAIKVFATHYGKAFVGSLLPDVEKQQSVLTICPKMAHFKHSGTGIGADMRTSRQVSYCVQSSAGAGVHTGIPRLGPHIISESSGNGSGQVKEVHYEALEWLG